MEQQSAKVAEMTAKELRVYKTRKQREYRKHNKLARSSNNYVPKKWARVVEVYLPLLGSR